MCASNLDGEADVRFFGKNDRASVDSKNCIKYTEKCPSVHLGPHENALKEAQSVSEFLSLDFGMIDSFAI